ncbi:MAG: YigZ family protein [Firmicutes bacterium]|nr:YigZ family protein [Bacillota bacterium]
MCYNINGDFMKSIEYDVQNEIVIERSKFITKLFKIQTEEEAKNILNDLNKQYNDATHICYSYIIGNIKRFNDDGEPGGTAGMPILNVLENNNLNYILAVVIRYFGGIKLGAGGLVRAYSNSISECLKTVEVKDLVEGYKIEISFNYHNIDQINYVLKEITIANKNFDNIITYELLISNDQLSNITEKLNNLIIELKIKEQLLITL